MASKRKRGGSEQGAATPASKITKTEEGNLMIHNSGGPYFRKQKSCTYCVDLLRMHTFHTGCQFLFHPPPGIGLDRSFIVHYSVTVLWLVGCLGFNGPLRQYFSLYWAVSQREGEGGEEKTDECKNVQTTPTCTYYKRSRPLPYCNPNCRMPRHWKFTQHHRTT